MDKDKIIDHAIEELNLGLGSAYGCVGLMANRMRKVRDILQSAKAERIAELEIQLGRISRVKDERIEKLEAGPRRQFPASPEPLSLGGTRSGGVRDTIKEKGGNGCP